MNNYGAKVCVWLEDRRPDIVTLQKIGLSKEFPAEALRKVGYESKFLLGGRSGPYPLGVAILSLSQSDSRQPEVRTCGLPGDGDKKSYFLTVSFGELWVSSVYAPSPNPGSARTVDWLNRLRDHIDNQRYALRPSVLCGDFNVRADDISKGKLQRALEELKNLGFVDLYRKAHPSRKEKPGFTRGYGQEYPSRLHLALASKKLAQCLRDVYLDVDSRRREDAPPLVVDLDGTCVNAGRSLPPIVA